MIDGISLLIRDREEIENIIQNKKLEFKPFRSYHSAQYKGLHIKLRNSSCYINGSLHKFKNGGVHNADNFTYYDLEKVLSDLYNDIGINPENTEIQNLEIGVNIKLPYSPDKFIQSIIKQRTLFPTYSCIGLEFRHQQYCIKIYSKSRQNKLFNKENILRLEIRFEKMIELNKRLGMVKDKFGVRKFKYLTDLSQPSIWRQAGNHLVRVLDNLDIIDMYKVMDSNIPDKDKVQIYEWERKSRIEENSNKRYLMKNNISKLIEKYSLTTIKDDVKHYVKLQIEDLLMHPKIQEYDKLTYR